MGNIGKKRNKNMKKIILPAVLLATGTVMASITSSSIVGYVTGTVTKNKYTVIPVQFNTVGGTASTVYIKDLVSESNAAGGGSYTAGTADKILKWDPSSGYTTYFRYNGVTPNIWCKQGETTETTDTVSVGESVFYKKGTLKNGSYTQAGEIFNGESAVFTLPKNKYALIAYPWPVDIAVKDVGALITNPGAGGSATAGLADKIMLWNETTGYVTYFRKTGDVWCKEGETEETTDVIPAGAGFFVKKGTLKDGTITFTKPAGL